MHRHWYGVGCFHVVIPLFFALLVFTGASAQTVVAVDPSTLNVSTPAAFTLNIRVNAVVNLHAASIAFTFDRQYLSYSKAEVGPFLSGALMLAPPVAHGPVYDTVVVDQALLGATAVSGSGVLLVLTFVPLKPGRTDIGLPATILFGGQLGDISIPSTSVGGEVVLESTVPITVARFVAYALPAGESVRVEWSTLSELNNYGFWIDRRRSGEVSYAVLPGSFTEGGGTTLEPRQYSYVDNTIPGPGRYEYRLRQVDQDGTEHMFYGASADVVVAGVAGAQPLEFQLMQNYPNPFNPTTVIEYQVPDPPGVGGMAARGGLSNSVGGYSSVSLRVYDVLGEEVAVLVDKEQAPGRYTVTFNAAGLSSGVYIYRLTAGALTALKSLLLLR